MTALYTLPYPFLTSLLRGGWVGLLVLFFSVGTALAQPGERGDEIVDSRVRAQRVAFMTSRLELTSREAEAFWPIFNEYEAAQQEIKKKSRPRRLPADLDDRQAEQLIEQQLASEEQQLALKRRYTQRFLQVLPARKVVMIPRIDREFKRELLRRLQQRRTRQ